MSNIVIEDAGWKAIMADPQLQRARQKLSFHEIRLIVNHARAFRRHDYWGAGEADCPSEIKAGNGELHTLRCKVCGKDDPRDDRCLAGPPICCCSEEARNNRIAALEAKDVPNTPTDLGQPKGIAALKLARGEEA